MEPRPEPIATSISLSAYWHLLRRNRNFRYLWMAQIVSEIGDWFYSLAIYSLLLQLTGRASSVALALVLQVLPQTFIGPTAGIVNDRIRRKQVMIVADLARVVVVLAMLVVRSRSVVWMVYPLLFLETCMATFFEPARNAVVPNITSREEVILANTLSSTTWSLNLMIGATLGGIVAAFLGRDAVFVLNALSFLASAFLIRQMRFKEPHTAAFSRLRFSDLLAFSPVLEGIRYVRRNSRLLATVFAKAGELMIGPSWVLFTVMGQKVFPVRLHGADAQRGMMLGMSLLLGARGVGALAGPMLSARFAGNSDRRLRLGILFGYLLVAAGYAAMGGAANVWLACLCVMLAHSGGSTVWVFSTTLLQLHTEDQFRGRVFAADLALSMLTIAVGAYLCGRFLDWGFTPRTVATSTGVIMLIPAALWGWSMSTLKGRERAVQVASPR
jgi:predicted MFS family arabinose efflux permease